MSLVRVVNLRFKPENCVLVVGGARSGKSSFAERLASSAPASNRVPVLAADGNGADDPVPRVSYIATAKRSDPEMRDRIEKHVEDRRVAGKVTRWTTIEEPQRLTAAVRKAVRDQGADAIVIDCLTVWLANYMSYRGRSGGASTTDVHGRHIDASQSLSPDPDDGDGVPPMPKGEELDDESVQWSKAYDSAARDEIRRAITAAQQEAMNIGQPKHGGPVVTLIFVANEVGMGIVPQYKLSRYYRDTLGKINQDIGKVAERAYFMVAGLALDLKQLDAAATLAVN
ncbi:Cobinamide kinase/cobinamide phosphate guanyltransferase [Cladochytrium replicatum]|nr:Cobinamide kinase/cobinamide phosphate guanyltransferase [Cladochytrium replicatum]